MECRSWKLLSNVWAIINLFQISQLTRHVAAVPPKHGLTPPVLDHDIHVLRCLDQLRSKDKNLEKYLYLSYLKTEDPHMFYKLCLEHMSEITPIIYTPTVGDACLHFSRIYRRPEGLVCIARPSLIDLELTMEYSTFPSRIKERFAMVCVILRFIKISSSS